MTERRLWDRQPNEPSKWYARFVRYRNMGPQRSMNATYRAEPSVAARIRDGKTPPDSVPSGWNQNKVRWNWLARAEAWDDEQLRLAEKEEQELVAAERKARIEMIRAARQLLGRELGEMVKDPSKLRQASLGAVIQSMQTVLTLQRSEFGELRDRLEVSGPDGDPIRTESAVAPMDLSALPDDVIESLLAAKQQAKTHGTN